MEKNEKKRVYSEITTSSSNVNVKCQNKNEVVGWPPVCAYRRKNSFNGREGLNKMYVKVSMDVAPFLRKVDMSTHKGYDELVMVFEKLFDCYGIDTYNYDIPLHSMQYVVVLTVLVVDLRSTLSANFVDDIQGRQRRALEG
ncbi:Auxin-induced protein AUX22 [Capsicum baccatum]|uniref:Auxin-responsive protein n=1 Tax=Capsicum baccatum TaxID=33114 RepID=A0A2G2UWP4_CAPBA|nr:Auxin-induced protein AUX22 [Capsicum baccatum]